MKLSIIVPIYGVAKYLSKCVDSLLAQDISDYEIILVDDGSPDESPEICDQYAGRYSNIKVIHQENAGLSAARNAGLAIAKGEYIMYVDSDDYLQPNVLGALLAQAERDQLDVLRFRYQNVNESGEAFAPYKDMTNYNDYSAIPIDGLTFLTERMSSQCYAWQFILKADIAKKELFTPGIYFEDTDWTPRMLLRAKRVASADLVVYNYLWREGSITLCQKDIAKQRKQLQDKMDLLRKLNDWGNKVEDRRWFDGMISSLVVNIVGMLAWPFFSERKEYIKRIKTLAILPISTYHIAPRAKRKVRLINRSIDLTIYFLRMKKYISLQNTSMKVIIDPRSNYSYGSFYVYGLINLFGNKNVIYRLKPFEELKDLGNDLRFIIRKGNEETKYFIHTNDSYRLSIEDYNWCDVYGCVNANFMHYPKAEYPKLVSLVPSFGIRQESSLFKLLVKSCVQLLSCWSYVINRKEWNKRVKKEECNKLQNLKHFFGRRYKTWRNRLPLSFYENTIISKNDYVFFLSTLWYSDEWNKNDQGVNLRRAYFIRACKKILSDSFEGGLLGDEDSSYETFEDVLVTKRAIFTLWIEKTKQSALVFNTPAFWDCHGWKLGEYLAMGKCIVSTKLSNDLPYPLEHGVNIHFVDDTEESMKEAVEYIISHPEYRHKLEEGAKKYWETYGTPEASLKLLRIKQ